MMGLLNKNIVLFFFHALVFQSLFPLLFWGECVLTTIYLINNLPSPLLTNKFPFELLHHRPPSLAQLRVFSCPCPVIIIHPLINLILVPNNTFLLDT